MSSLFNTENRFWQFMNEVADMIILSMLWLVFCIPIVTIGPATAAVYYVMLKKTNDESDESPWTLFWRSFRRNIKQGIVIGLIYTALAVVIYIDIRFYAHAQGSLRPLLGSMTVVFGGMMLLMMPYVFGQLARFENTIRKFFVNSFYLALRHIIRSVLMAAVLVLGVAALLYYPVLIVIVPALVMRACAWFLARSFEQHMPKEDAQEDDLSEAPDDHTAADDTKEEGNE